MKSYKLLLRKALLAVYFCLWLALVSYVTYRNLSYSVWPVLIVVLGYLPLAFSMLFYIFDFRPKGFSLLGKISWLSVFLLMIWGWYFLPRHPMYHGKTFLVWFLGFISATIFFSPSYYFSLRYGFASKLPPSKFNLKIFIISLIITITANSISLLPPPVVIGKINVSVDYVAKCNEISKPAIFFNSLNAKPYLDKAFGLLVKEPNEIGNVIIKWPDDINGPQRKLMQKWINENKQTLIHLHIAASYPYYWSEYESSDGTVVGIKLKNLSDFRKVVYLMCADAKLLAIEGNYQASFDSIINVYKLGSFFSCKKTIVEQLVGLAIRSLSVKSSKQILYNTDPPESVLADFQMKIEMLTNQADYRLDMTLERIMLCDLVQRIFTDDGQGGGYLSRRRAKAVGLGWIWRRIDRQETVELIDKVFNYADTMSNKTPAQLFTENIDMTMEIDNMISSNPFVKMFILAHEEVHRMSYRVQGDTDALLIILALQRYKFETRQYPESLDVLQKEGYIDQLPIDPFSDKPFVYKKTNDDFILYSYAYDCNDDNGEHDHKWANDGDGDYVYWPVQEDKADKK